MPLRPSEPGLPGDPCGPTGPVLPCGPSRPDSPCGKTRKVVNMQKFVTWCLWQNDRRANVLSPWLLFHPVFLQVQQPQGVPTGEETRTQELSVNTTALNLERERVGEIIDIIFYS